MRHGEGCAQDCPCAQEHDTGGRWVKDEASGRWEWADGRGTVATWHPQTYRVTLRLLVGVEALCGYATTPSEVDDVLDDIAAEMAYRLRAQAGTIPLFAED